MFQNYTKDGTIKDKLNKPQAIHKFLNVEKNVEISQ